MVHGNYPVQDVEGSKPARKDSSYKSCVITMFIVFLLCIIIILILWQTKSDSSDVSDEDFAKQTGTKLDAHVPPPVFSSTSTKPPVLATTKLVTDGGTTTTSVETTSIASKIYFVVAPSISLSTPTEPPILTSSSSRIETTIVNVSNDRTTTEQITSVASEMSSSFLPPVLRSTPTESPVSTTSSDAITSIVTVGANTTITKETTSDFPKISTLPTTESSFMKTTPNITTVDNVSGVTNVTTEETTSDSSQTTQSPVIASTGATIIHKDNETCQTNECKVLASRMLSLMNHSVEPCNNFYEYACGGLRENYALLQEDPELDVWKRIQSALEKVDNSSHLAYQEFRHFYDQCVDYEFLVNQSVRLTLAQGVMGEVDNMYNITEWKNEDKNFNFTNLLIKLFSHDSAPLFDISVDVNPHMSTNFQLKLTVPRSKTKLQLESLSELRCKSYIKADDPDNIDMKSIYEKKYLTCVRNFSEYFNTLNKAVVALGLYGETDEGEVTEHISNITSFIQSDVFSSLQEIDPWRIRVNTLEKNFTTMTVEDLQTQYPEVEWKVLLESLSDTTVDNGTEVQLYFENYFNKLFEHLKEKLSDSTNRLVIHNGLLAMLAHDIYVDLIKPRPCDREDYCLKITSGLMKYASSSLYLSTFTAKELSDKTNELVTLFNELKNVLKEEISNASWLDHNSTLDKLDKMTVIANGSRDVLLDAQMLSSSFSSSINMTSHYFENAIQLLRQERKIIYKHLGFNPLTPQAILFFSLPSDTRPVSVYQLNSVILPYGMIGSWKLNNNLPSFIWKTHIGNEIARQIVHHFDTTGIKYSATGIDTDFLKGTSNSSYVDNYIKCEEAFHDFIWTSQKNQKYIYQVNAARTMNEHLTDNSALWLTHKLYKKTALSELLLPWLEENHDELYLLLAAQRFCAKKELLDYTITMFETEHFAPYLRVKNVIEDSGLFADVYKCPTNTSNNSSLKCAPFPALKWT